MVRLNGVQLSCVEAAITCLHIQNKAAITCLHIQNKAAITCLHDIFIILTILLDITDRIQCQEKKEKHPGLV